MGRYTYIITALKFVQNRPQVFVLCETEAGYTFKIAERYADSAMKFYSPESVLRSCRSGEVKSKLVYGTDFTLYKCATILRFTSDGNLETAEAYDVVGRI